jgi:hypothetical protein
VDPERSHLISRECIISGRGERQGTYTTGRFLTILLLLLGQILGTVSNFWDFLYNP